MRDIGVPMLLLQGTRDDLAQLDLITGVLHDLPRATLHAVEGADHSFHVRKKSGRTDEEVVVELAQAFARWAQAISGERSNRM